MSYVEFSCFQLAAVVMHASLMLEVGMICSCCICVFIFFFSFFFWSLHFKGKLQSICLNSRDKREAIEVGPEGILFI